MATTTDSTENSPPSDSQAAGQLKTTLASADAQANQGIQTQQSVHQARLSQATRTVASLTAQYGAGDPRVKTAAAAVAARTATIGRISMVRQQLAAPAVQVAANAWGLQGRVVDANLQPAARFTVFLVNDTKAFQREYGFAYTDGTGYFQLIYAEANGQLPTAKLFIEVANTDANPVYLSSTPFQPVLGTAPFQNITLPAGGQPIGDPPEAIRAVALPK